MKNEIWYQNINSMGERYKLLKEAILTSSYLEKDNDKEKENITFQVTDVADKKVLYVEKNDNPILLDSLYDSNEMLNLWKNEKGNIGYKEKFILFGIGNGMYVKKILEEGDKTCRILVYEPCILLFIKALEYFDFSQLLQEERVTIIVEDYFEDSFERYAYQFVDFMDLKHLTYEIYPNYDQFVMLQVKKMDEFIQLMYNIINANQDVLGRNGKEYCYNSIYNVPWFIHSKSVFDLYKKLPKDIPVIIVASGPSLDKNIEHLKEAKRKCIMISADSALNTLLAHNIIPDFFVSIDGKKLMSHFADERVVNIPLICELSSQRNLLKNRKDQTFFLNDSNTYVDAFFAERGKVLPIIQAGGSVAHTAFGLAAAMKFKHIILVGQDLAYTDNKTHSVHTVRGKQGIDASTLDHIMIEGYYGGLVPTSYEFQIYLDWFEDKIKQYSDINVINATEGGALIHGATNQSLQKTVEQLCTKEVDITGIINEIEDLFTSELKEEFKNYFISLENNTEEILTKVKQGIRDYEKIEKLAYDNKLGSGQIQQLFKRTSEITNYIESNPTMYYIQCLMQEYTNNMFIDMYETKEDPREEIICVAKKGKEYLEEVAKSISLFIKIFNVEWEDGNQKWKENNIN